MSKIIGIGPTKTFTTKDGTGTVITGRTFFVTDPIEHGGQGESANHFFLTEAKYAGLGFAPSVNTDVEVLYNKFGKVQTLRQIDEGVDFGDSK